MAARYTLGSESRLKRGQHIETLFHTGKAFSVFPLRIIWLLVPRGEEASPTRAGFSAPKRKFKRATDRNRVKRLLRESWRLQQARLHPLIPEDMQLQLFLLFTDATLPEYETVHRAVTQAIAKLEKSLTPHA